MTPAATAPCVAATVATTVADATATVAATVEVLLPLSALRRRQRSLTCGTADGPRGRPRVALTKAVAAPKKKSNPFGDATPIKSKADMLVEEQAKKAAAAKAKKDAEEAKKAAEAPAEAPAADAAPADEAAAPAADAAAEVAEVAEKVADVKVEE